MPALITPEFPNVVRADCDRPHIPLPNPGAAPAVLGPTVTNQPPAVVIDIHVRELNQLFDSMDPSPFREQDLAPGAEEYIVDSVRELRIPGVPELHVHVDQTAGVDEAATASAIRTHFSRRAQHVRRNLRDLIRDGLVSLAIGITALVVFFVAGEVVVRMGPDSPWRKLVRESLFIGGWVAMWRPLEIFLYAWWPIARERRLLERLSRATVHVVRGQARG